MNGDISKNNETPPQSKLRIGHALLEGEGGMVMASTTLMRLTAPWKTPEQWWLEATSRLILPAPVLCPVCQRDQRLGVLEVSVPLPTQIDIRVFRLEFTGHTHELENVTPPREMLLVQDITEEKRRADATRQAIHQYESICNTIEEVYFRIDPRGRILFITPSCQKLVLYHPDELIDTPLDKLCSAPELLAEFLEIVHGQTRVKNYELTLFCKQGKQIPVNINAQLLLDPSGQPMVIEGSLLDISERERLDNLLVERTRTFQESLAHLENLRTAQDRHALVTITDAEGTITHVNDLLLRTSRFDASEVIGKNPRLFNSGYHPKPFYQEMWQRISSGRIWKGEIRNRKKNGDHFWVDCTIVPFLNPIGKPTHHIAIATDVTERVRTGMRLERNRNFLNRVLDAMGDGLIILDLEGRLLSINREGERLLGWRESELVNRNFHDTIHHKHVDGTPFRSGDCPVHHNVLGRTFRVEEDHFIHKNGAFIPVSHTTAPLREAGEIIGSVSIFRDNTLSLERHQVLEETRKTAMASSRMKSEFLANMSHEIRTPMNAIVGMNDLLMDTPLNEEQYEFAEIIRESSLSLLSLINDILDFSKIEADKIDIEEIDFNIVTVVEGSAELLATQAQEKGLSLMTYISPRIPRILRGDPGRLRQMLLNLISNAIKFTEEGEVVVRAHVESEAADRVIVHFSVTDTGIGLPEGNKERLFEPFTQASRDTTRKYGGTGLGLAICKRLSELMGGGIGVESGDGEGTSFWLRIPLWTRQTTLEEDDGSDRLDIEPLCNLRILTIMDRSTDHEILEKYFRSWGMFHRGVLGGEQGASVMRQTAKGKKPFDLVMISSGLTDVNPLALAEDLQQDPPLGNTRLVALMDWEDKEFRELAPDAGFSGTITKPVRQSTLVNTLLELVHPEALSPRIEAISDNIPTREAAKPEPDAYEALESGKLLLLVEDNPVNQKVTLLQLKKMGFAAHAVFNGKEALEAVSHLPYALILMDCQMPVMDGFEATHAIRKLDRASSRHIPIIAMTANAMKGDRERCLRAGMDDYLSKPVAPETLKEKLEYWIPKRSGETPPIEINQLRQLFGDDDEMIRELLQHFQPSARELLDKLWQSIQERDEDQLIDSAFELKEACSNMGATGMGHLARNIEQGLNNDGWEKMGEMMNDMEETFQRIGVFVKEY